MADEKHVFPLADLDIKAATVHPSPTAGMVRVCFDITVEDAYELSYRCTKAYQAGFAGGITMAAFSARYGHLAGQDKPESKAA